MDKMYYTYALRSLQDYDNYTGYTENLKLRFEQNQKDEVNSTKNRRPHYN
jgi:putative endonuclease